MDIKLELDLRLNSFLKEYKELRELIHEQVIETAKIIFDYKEKESKIKDGNWYRCDIRGNGDIHYSWEFDPENHLIAASWLENYSGGSDNGLAEFPVCILYNSEARQKYFENWDRRIERSQFDSKVKKEQETQKKIQELERQIAQLKNKD